MLLGGRSLRIRCYVDAHRRRLAFAAEELCVQPTGNEGRQRDCHEVRVAIRIRRRTMSKALTEDRLGVVEKKESSAEAYQKIAPRYFVSFAGK